VIRFSEHPELTNQIGNDIITTDGTTLLGADNKAGIAEIMDGGAFLHRQSRREARHHQDPVHAGRGNRPWRRTMSI
jgi:di/tripeptidase